jgi:hypothetical protein
VSTVRLARGARGVSRLASIGLRALPDAGGRTREAARASWRRAADFSQARRLVGPGLRRQQDSQARVLLREGAVAGLRRSGHLRRGCVEPLPRDSGAGGAIRTGVSPGAQPGVAGRFRLRMAGCAVWSGGPQGGRAAGTSGAHGANRRGRGTVREADPPDSPWGVDRAGGAGFRPGSGGVAGATVT